MDDIEIRDETFRQQALKYGYSPEEIDFELKKRHAAMSTAQKVAYHIAKAAPAVMGTATSFAGFALGNLPGMALGGFSGVAAGEAVEDMILRLSGIRTPQTKPTTDAILQATIDGLISAAANVGIGLTGKAIGTGAGLLSGKMSTKIGAKLGAQRAGVELPREMVEKDLAQALQKSHQYRMADSEMQAKMLDKLKTMLDISTKGENVNLQELYQSLNGLRGTTSPGVYNVLHGSQGNPGVIKTVLNQYQPSNIAGTAKLYSTTRSAEKFLRQSKNSLARSLPWILGGGWLAGKVKKTLGESFGP